MCHRYERERGLLLIFRFVERGRVVINVHFPSSAADFVSGLPVGRPAVRLAVGLTGWLAGLLSRRRANDIVPCSTNMAPELEGEI